MKWKLVRINYDFFDYCTRCALTIEKDNTRSPKCGQNILDRDYGSRYSLGASTWNSELLNQQFDHRLVDIAIGENPWSEFIITSTIETPNN